MSTSGSELPQARIESPGTGPRTCVSGSQKPPSRCATGREKRCAVSLAFFYALRAYKGKGKVEAFLKRKRVRPADVPQKTLISLRSAPGAHVRFSLAQARRSAAAPWRELRAQALGKTFTLASLGIHAAILRFIPAYPSFYERMNSHV